MPRSTCLAGALLLLACGGPAVGPAAGPDDPIVAPPEQWAWVGFPDSACANGQPTGIGVNLTGRSSDVVVYFQGGGACWSAETCLGFPPTAINLSTGYGAAAFAAEPARQEAAFDRGSSPFQAASFVFVPYCTGDLHAGDSTRVYTFAATTRAIHHAGGSNTALFLRRLAATFPGARRVFVTGSSAGGYAAQLNYPSFAAAFPDAEVHALADAAQVVQPAGTRLTDWQAAWGWTPPAGCTACATQLPALASWLSATWPTRRFALLASTQDTVLTAYLGYADTASFDLATRALLTDRYDPTANARYFALPGTRHVMLDDLTLASGGTSLATWVTRWYSGDAAWDSVGP
jgi:pectinacetylesterase